MKKVARRLTAGAAVVGLAAGLSLTVGVGSASASYNDCTYGKVCLWTGTWGNGIRWEAPGCGSNLVSNDVRFNVRSIRTFGNPIELLDSHYNQFSSVGRWTSTNTDDYTTSHTAYVRVNC